MARAFLCGLGRMGRRHLVGLVRAGFEVSARDVSPDALVAARAALADANAPASSLFEFRAPPEGQRFEVAVFAETAPERHADVASFLEGNNRASRYLLEKPLTCDARLLEDYPALFARYGVAAESVRVDLPYRSCELYAQLAALAKDSSELVMSVVGGAVGIGCNGIHYADMFDVLAGPGEDEIVYARLSPSQIASSRGDGLRDFGGDFVARRARATLFLSLSAESSAAAVTTVRGDHFIARLDENEQAYRIQRRDPASRKANGQYGQDYRVHAEGPAPSVRFEEMTAAWARGALELPSLEVGLRTQRLVFRMLDAAAAPRPYRFS